jgi:hypothetical protein
VVAACLGTTRQASYFGALPSIVPAQFHTMQFLPLSLNKELDEGVSLQVCSIVSSAFEDHASVGSKFWLSEMFRTALQVLAEVCCC